MIPQTTVVANSQLVFRKLLTKLGRNISSEITIAREISKL
jgi:hypothetical protein